MRITMIENVFDSARTLTRGTIYSDVPDELAARLVSGNKAVLTDGNPITSPQPAILSVEQAAAIAAGWRNVIRASGNFAQRPSASAGLAGAEYFALDLNGGTLFACDGVSWVQIAIGLTEGADSVSTWASRGAGGAIGERKRISDVGNCPLVESIWNGSRWVPRGGRQLIYEIGAPIVSASATTQTCTLPNVTVPAGLMGLTGAIEIELGWELGAGTPLTRVLAMGWGGSPIVDDSATLHRRFTLRRTVRNIGSAAAQQVLERQADYATYQSINTTGQQKTKDTAADVVIDGSVVSTYGSATTAAIMQYRIWWVGVGA